MIANSVTLISDEYRAQQEHLHATTEYGTAAQSFGPLVSQIVENMGVTHLLDYGCGSRMSLLKTLKVKGKLTYQGYDPGAGREDLADPPYPAQMVVCIDVLEHIEPAFLDNVLDHLASLTEAIGFFTVHCGPARKVLSDGRNAHLTQQPPEWWLPKIMQRFDLQNFARNEGGFQVIVYAKPRIESKNGHKLVA